MISRAKGKQTQITSYYDPDVAERLKALSEGTRVPQAVYLREATDDLLKKYEATKVKALMFEGEEFQGDQHAGSGVLIWGGTPAGRRRFFLSTILLADELGCKKPSVEVTAINCCKENRPKIEAACTHAYNRVAGSTRGTVATQIDLQTKDFL
jgi:hypothetical protein